MNDAERYHAAIKRLSKAEQQHRKNLEALAQAISARASSQTGSLRRECERTESELSDALQAARAAYRCYWIHRRDAMQDELCEAARVIATYNVLARLAGDVSATPALTRLQNLAIYGHPGADVVGLCDADGVPTDAPDSALLEDERGAWRP